MEHATDNRQQLIITDVKPRWVGRYRHSWRLVIKNIGLLDIEECRGRMIAIADEVSQRNPGLRNWPDGYFNWSDGRETTSIQQGESKELEIVIRTGIDEPILLAYIQGDDYRKDNAIRTGHAFLILISITGNGVPPLYAVCAFYPWWDYKNHGLRLVDSTLTQPDIENYQKPISIRLPEIRDDSEFPIRQILLQPDTRRMLADAQTSARGLTAPDAHVDYPTNPFTKDISIVTMISNAKRSYQTLINKLEGMPRTAVIFGGHANQLMTALTVGMSLLKSYEEIHKRPLDLDGNSQEIDDRITDIQNIINSM